MAFPLLYLYLTLDHPKGQGQGHAHLTANASQIVTDRASIAIANN